MMDVNGLITVIGDTFFGGDVGMAGVVMFSVVLLVLMALTRSVITTLLISLPASFVFNTMGWIPKEMMILLIIVVVLSLAYETKKVWKD